MATEGNPSTAASDLLTGLEDLERASASDLLAGLEDLERAATSDLLAGLGDREPFLRPLGPTECTLANARMAAFHQILLGSKLILLTGEEFQRLRTEKGLSKGQVEKAVEGLITRGQASVSARDGCVEVTSI